MRNSTVAQFHFPEARLKREKSLEARAAGAAVVDDESEVGPQTDWQKTTADYLAEDFQPVQCALKSVDPVQSNSS
jgi:hypothetical protein